MPNKHKIFNPPSLLRELRRMSSLDAEYLRAKAWFDSPDLESGKVSPELALGFIPVIVKKQKREHWNFSIGICLEFRV